jgi:hypothetical protein
VLTLVNPFMSIDGLLEKTVKHMLFLQSVTKNADKLKDSTESKVCTFFTI